MQCISCAVINWYLFCGVVFCSILVSCIHIFTKPQLGPIIIATPIVKLKVWVMGANVAIGVYWLVFSNIALRL